MWKSMIFKEWIKVRWFLVIFTLLALMAIGYIFIRVQHDFTFNEAKNYWYSVLFQGFQYFRYLKYLPLAGGIALAIAQYFPETVNKRIKLTFHLPVNEDMGLLMMMLFGSVCLLLSFGILFLFFLGMSSTFFPAEITRSAVISVIPWFLAGYASYYMVALVILEPVWLYRFLYFIATIAFVPLFLKTGVAGAYAPLNLILTFFVVLVSISLLFSGYRFRKGEM
jgi:hypothetical protein